MNNEPKVSIIIPTFNRIGILPKAIESVLKQNYSNWELIIVDDHSSDETSNVVSQYIASDSRIKYLLNSRGKGVSKARNCGIEKACGEFIAFLDSDDLWEKNHLCDCIKAMQKSNVNVSIALWMEKNKFGQTRKVLNIGSRKQLLDKAINELGTYIEGNSVVFRAPQFIEFALINNLYCYHINTMVIKTEIIYKVGMFDEKMKASEDYDFIHRVMINADFCFVLDYHYTYIQGEDNIHNFMDRKEYNLDNLLTNRTLIKRLSFCHKYQCKALYHTRKMIGSSNKFAQKKLCLKACSKKLGKKYFTLGYINKYISKTTAFFYILKSLVYEFKFSKLKILINIIFPNILKNIPQPEDINL